MAGKMTKGRTVQGEIRLGKVGVKVDQTIHPCLNMLNDLSLQPMPMHESAFYLLCGQ